MSNHKPWNKGLTKTKQKFIYPYVYEHKCIYCGNEIIIRNVRERRNALRWGIKKFCNHSCKVSWRNKNIPQTERQRKLSSERAKKIFTGLKKTTETRLRMALANIGDKSHFWKGGYVTLARRLRNSAKIIDWRKKVFERDNYTCVSCKERNGNGYTVVLQADHIIPFSKIFNEFIKLQTEKDENTLYEKALAYEPLWDINNGRTLCNICHQATTTYSYKANFINTNKIGEGIYLNTEQKKLIELRKIVNPRSGICKNCGKITRFRTTFERQGFCTRYCFDQFNKTGSFKMIDKGSKVLKCIICNRDFQTKWKNKTLCSIKCSALFREQKKKRLS